MPTANYHLDSRTLCVEDVHASPPVRADKRECKHRIARFQDVEDVLRQLQLNIESAGSSPELRRYRRAVLRGFRAALWIIEAKPTIEELAKMLKDEVYGRST